MFKVVTSMKRTQLLSLFSGVILSAIAFTGCEKRPKQEVPIAGEREAVTQFGKAVEQARELSASADQRNEELTVQLDEAIE
jgi:hypothetical protein